ncbi:hypothetical protein SBOR_0458 [Sclerotinia borealis F-4128]|uniref:Calcineurin-like phosphoesterase domain-containing protein n=1 Tax=Sclerotinia borealis (strain F-4128) TaxID=1432307 RepID=W9CWZ8_SCLBF|nr:hypothetical protein SBOR_0458 [Sclerotinia borealis F-4128]
MAFPPTKVPTRIMIISDTHNYQFGTPPIPLPLSLSNIPPNIDVLLHCGDLTERGALSEYRGALLMLQQIPAKLKLVIGGNHDRTLDLAWVKRNLGFPYTTEEEEEDLGEWREANNIMRGEMAREAGVTYLEEGVYDFNLQNGAALRVYASPYTPEYCRFGWAYERDEDRFNGAEERDVGMKGVDGSVRITSFAEDEDGRHIDIVMTHGPPMNILDKCDGYAQRHVGCSSLLRALGRARPRLFCCGHIHEAHGAGVARWGIEGVEEMRKVECQWPSLNREIIEEGKETLMVNASIMDVKNRPVNKPWYVELDLPKAIAAEVGR